MDTTANRDYRAQLEFEEHVRSNFIRNLQETARSTFVCGSNFRGDPCNAPAVYALAWKRNDNRQGEIVTLCEHHADALVEIGAFADNDYFLPYCFYVELEDGKLPAGWKVVAG